MTVKLSEVQKVIKGLEPVVIETESKTMYIFSFVNYKWEYIRIEDVVTVREVSLDALRAFEGFFAKGLHYLLDQSHVVDQCTRVFVKRLDADKEEEAE